MLAKGYRVRCLARDPNRLQGRNWEGPVELAAGDVLDRDSLVNAIEGCGTAYYLVHSMASGTGSFRERDLRAARNFASAAAEAHVERIIYLGGLGRRSEQLSHHLSSRHEVGDVLRAGSVPTTELRAAMIIGSGGGTSRCFALVSRLPVMVCPRWVANRTQPIAIRSVLAYLIGCMENPATAGQVFDIGGPDVLTYKEMMERFAAILGLSPLDDRRACVDAAALSLLGEPGHTGAGVDRLPVNRGTQVGDALRGRSDQGAGCRRADRLRRCGATGDGAACVNTRSNALDEREYTDP